MPAIIGALAPILIAVGKWLLVALGKMLLAAFSYLIVMFLVKLTPFLKDFAVWVMSLFRDDNSDVFGLGLPSDIPDLTAVVPTEWLQIFAMLRIDDSLSLIATGIVFKIVHNFSSQSLDKFNEVIGENNP